MNTSDYEKLLISIVLRWPTTENLIAEKCSLKVQPDKFSVPEHKTIWIGIQSVIQKNKSPDIGNLLIELGDKINETYLRSLYDFSSHMKINSPDSWETYCEAVDKNGTLKQLVLLNEKYHRQAEDFEKFIGQVSDVDSFLHNYVGEIQRITSNISTHYVPISRAAEEDCIAIEKARHGNPDILICGMPSIEEFGIPYAPSLGIIQGLESKGKSQLAFQMILGKAIHLKKNNIHGCVAIDTLEMPRRAVHRRMVCFRAGIDSKKLKFGTATPEEYERYYHHSEYIQSLPIQVNHNIITSSKLKLEAIAQNIKCKRYMGMSDFARLFSDKGDNEEQRLSRICTNHKDLSKIVNSCEMLIAQLNRESRGNQAGLGKAKGTSSFEQDADWYVELINYLQMIASGMNPRCPPHRNENKAYVIVLKNKDGSLGEIELDWNATFTRFTDQRCKPGQLYNFEIEEEEPSDF